VKIILVDGSALLYRSHYALARNPLVNGHGEVTSAAFGTATALLRMFDEHGADAVMVAYDVPGKTFRHEIYPEYKAHRPPMPADLKAQIPRVKEVVRSMGLPLLEREGFEADDLIGTLAVEGAASGHEMWIYSSDKDFVPLIRPGIGMLKPAGRGAEDRYIDERAVRKEYGVRPAQFLDALTIMGDKADNVPGVPGIGEKTALKLVAQFGSLERLYENLDAKGVSPRQRKLLQEHREQLEFGARLLRIDAAAPHEFEWRELRAGAPLTPEFRALCRELEFFALLERYDDGSGASFEPGLRQYMTIMSLAELDAALAELQGAWPWAVDTETTGLDPMRAELVGISIANTPHRAIYIPVDAGGRGAASGDLFGDSEAPRLPWEDVRARLGPLLADASLEKLGQNLKYDQIVLAQHGAPLAGVCFDTLIASHLLAPERRQHGMDALAEELLGETTKSYKSLFEGMDTKDIRRVPLDRLAYYAAEDADITYRLYQTLDAQIELEGMGELLREVELPLSQVLLRMERRGVCLDVQLLDELATELRATLAELRSELVELAGEEFNLNSPRQLQKILFEKLGLKPVKRTSTGYSTDVDVLTRLSDEHPLPAKLLEHRQAQKLLSTYVEALPKLVHPQTGCVHTSYSQAVAATGRLSSTDPNLQNIPVRSESGRKIRAAFVPRQPGWSLLAADYSQIELRLAAHFSQDEVLLNSFLRGEDIHARTAALVAGVEMDAVDPDMRRRAKAINFGILYGMGARALAQQLGIKSKEAQEFIDQYFARLPSLRDWIDRTIATAREQKEVRTLLGRRRRLPELVSTDPRQRAFGERIAVNTPVQGSAADLIKLAMLRIDERIEAAGHPVLMLLQVHDELVFEVRDDFLDEAAALVRDEMEGVGDLSVPLVVDCSVGANWAMAHA
jgi:DNA polymerase-1